MTSHEPNDNFAEYIASGTVSIYLGPKRKEYFIHKKLLCDKSVYFSNALQGGFREGQENKLHLEEETPGAFELFVRWIYTGTLPEFTISTTMAHLQLYVMADKMLLTVLKNEVLDRLRVNAIMWSLKAEVPVYVYKNTLPGSMMRKLVAHISGFNVKSFGILRGSSKGHQDARAELMDAVGRNGEFAADLIFAMDEAFTNINFKPVTDEKSYRLTEPAVNVGNEAIVMVEKVPPVKVEKT